MKKIALIYWPTGGSVEWCAKLFKEELADIELFPLEELNPEKVANYDTFIFGGSTVGADHWKNDATDNSWAKFFEEGDSYQLKGKKASIFGLGNQLIYPDQFVDGMAYIKKNLTKAGMTVSGAWPTEGYEFEESQAIEDDQFIGLVLDEDAQPEMTQERIQAWLKLI